MLLYNVTVKINHSVQADWLEWMQHTHIPDVVRAGNFEGAQLSHLLDQPLDDDPTYVIQYRCPSREHYEHYLAHHAPALRAQYDARYKGKYVAFRTLMQVL